MFYLAIFLTFISCQIVGADTFHGLQRLNFYPDVKAYSKVSYGYENFEIEAPDDALASTDINNYRNVFSASYAYYLDYFFLGAEASYELASESAANYGIASDKRFSSHGFKNPKIFGQARIRQQAGTTGKIDFFFAYSPELGPREIGNSGANRLGGREVYEARVSHGLLEDEWEFRNALEIIYFRDGEENNEFTELHQTLRPYTLFRYSFLGQYELTPWIYPYAGASFEYRTVQKIIGEPDTNREIQAGTGSIFQVGVKRPLGDWTILDGKVEMERYSYFVLGDTNFDGDAFEMTYSLSLVQGF